MRIFGSKQKQQDRDALLDKELIEQKYSDLPTALLGELNVGSQDAKLTTFTLPEERQVQFYSEAGHIRFIADSAHPVAAGSFLYWQHLSEEEKTAIAEAVQSEELTLEALSRVASSAPEHQELVEKALNSASLEAYLYLAENFSSVELIRTEIFADDALFAPLKNFSFGVQELSLRAHDLNDEIASVLARLELLGIAPEEIKLTLEEGAEPTSALESFIFSAAAANADFAMTRTLATGFLWSEVLEKLEHLIYDERIKLELPEDEFALPETIFETPQEESEEEWNFSEVSDPNSDDEAFDLEHGDGGFNFETRVEAFFTHTKGLELKLDEVFLTEVFTTTPSLERARQLAEANGALEEEIYELEENLIANQAFYRSQIEEFDERKFQEQLSEAVDYDEHGYAPEESLELMQERKEANRTFFNLAEAEAHRFTLNARREALLLELLSLAEAVRASEGFIDVLTLKLEGIATVENVAFHDPREEDVQDVDPAFLDVSGEKLQEQIAQELLEEDKSYDVHDTPLYYRLAGSLGLTAPRQ